MPLFKLQSELQSVSALPEDRIVNSLYVEGPNASGSNYGDLSTAFKNFWDLPNAPTTQPVRNFLSPRIVQNGHVVKVYRLDDVIPRVPLFTLTYNFGAAVSGDALPGEVAMCLSFRAPLESGTLARRRRGRIYIGPLQRSASDVGPDDSRPVDVFRNTVLNAAVAFEAAVNTAGYNWVVHSPTSGALARYPVTDLWVDNAFDTVRKRGRKPTNRLTRTVVPIALGA